MNTEPFQTATTLSPEALKDLTLAALKEETLLLHEELQELLQQLQLISPNFGVSALADESQLSSLQDTLRSIGMVVSNVTPSSVAGINEAPPTRDIASGFTPR